MKNNPIFLRTSSCDEITPDKKMALRFMGCKDFSGDTVSIYDRCLEEYKKVALFKAVYRKTSVTFYGEKGIRFDFGEIESADLRKNLEGCRSAFIFAATSGSAVDRLIMKETRLSAAYGMVTDCIASSGIEAFCDKINDELKEGRSLKPRYSPGYGDVSLTCQNDILSFVDAYRKIGLTLTETYLMTPIKSVTAIVGIMEENQ